MIRSETIYLYAYIFTSHIHVHAYSPNVQYATDKMAIGVAHQCRHIFEDHFNETERFVRDCRHIAHTQGLGTTYCR